jgi:uridine kinase
MSPVDIVAEVSSREPRCGSVRFVAVDGGAGSGKTTLASMIATELGAEIIHTDDFASWENPISWWPDVISQVFEPVRDGATTLSYERTQWWEHEHRPPIVDQPVTPIMVIEGVSASRREFRDFLSYSVFVDAPKDIRMARGEKRDLELGISESPEKVHGYWKEWDDEEVKYFERDAPVEHADLVIDGTKPFEGQITFLKAR